MSKGGKIVVTGLFLMGISGVGYYLHNQKKEVENIIDNLKIRLHKLTNFQADFNTIRADVYLKIINPIAKEFIFDTKFIKAKQLRVYSKMTNQNIAVTNLETTKIEILKKGTFYLPKMTISIPVLTGADMILRSIIAKQADFTKHLRFELDLEGFGKVVTFNFEG